MDVRRGIADRLKLARTRLKLTQEGLAERVGFQNRQTIGQIENCEREVKAWELSALARALHVQIGYFFVPDELRAQPSVLWRERADVAVEEEAAFLNKCDQYAMLERLNDLPEAERFPKLPSQLGAETFSYDDAARLADQCAKLFELGSQPADSLVSVLENRFRVKIWYLPLTRKGSAASTCGAFGYGILMNSDEAPWRRNFNFAHEVFHLLTWDCLTATLLESDTELKKRAESLANAFAAQLLLPADELIQEFKRRIENNKISYLALIEIARLYGVSTEALLYRLSNLRQLHRDVVKATLDDTGFRDLDRSTMRSNWGTPPAIPRRFVELAFFAFKQGRLSRALLAEMLGVSVLELEAKLQEYELSEAGVYEGEISVTDERAA